MFLAASLQEFPSQGQQEDSLSTKLSRLVNRCNTKEPTKLVNDLLTGLFDDQYLASHTITGATFKGYEGLQKEKMDPMTVNAIIGKPKVLVEVNHAFSPLT